MGEVVGTAVVEIHARIDDLEREIRRGATRGADKAGKDAGKVFGGSFKKNVAAFTGGLLAAGGIVGVSRSLINLGKDSLKAAADQSAANAIVEKSIQNVNAESELFGKSIEQVLEAESRATGFADDELAPAFSRLVLVTRDSAEAFKLLGLAQDVSRQRGQPLISVAQALARAQGGQITALRRIIPGLQAENAELSKQENVTRALNQVRSQFGGFRTAFSESDAGQIERVARSFDEIKETLGQAILPTVGRIADRIADWFADPKNQKRFENAIDDTLTTTEEIVRVGGKIGGILATPFKGFFEAGKLLNDDLQTAADAIDRIQRTEEKNNALVRERVKLAQEEVRLRKLGAREGLTSAERGITGPPTFGGEDVDSFNPNLVRRRRSTFSGDLDRQIRELQAELTESTSDNRELAEARRKNLQAQIEAIGSPRGKNDQARLINLYKELGQASEEINDIEQAAKDARDDAAEERKKIAEEERENARQRYRDDLSLSRDRIQLASLTASTEGQIKQARQREIDFLRERVRDTRLTNRERLDAQIELAQLEKEQNEEQKRIADERKEAKFSLREQRLQNAAQRAELTQSTVDDKKAQQALIRFYGTAAKQARRTRDFAKALQLESQKIGAQLAARGNQSSGSGGGARTDFFQEAADQFRRFGSNIGRASDPLSGQQARGQFAGLALDRGRNTSNLQGDQLRESQSQTDLLRQIRDRLRVDTRAAEGNQPPNRRPPNATDIARVNARNNLAGR